LTFQRELIEERFNRDGGKAMATLVERSSWTSEQSKTAYHWASIIIFGFVILFSYFSPVFLAVGYIGFLLVTSIKMI